MTLIIIYGIALILDIIAFLLYKNTTLRGTKYRVRVPRIIFILQIILFFMPGVNIIAGVITIIDYCMDYSFGDYQLSDEKLIKWLKGSIFSEK